MSAHVGHQIYTTGASDMGSPSGTSRRTFRSLGLECKNQILGQPERHRS